MFSLIKLFKALNSAGAEYQLALALAFGIMSGFLPFFSAINLFIVFIVFSINIPLGIYGIFVAFFSILGSILDPYFHQIGLALLTNPSFNELWTALYNTPAALWFSFNHTITLGSFIVASILFIPTYFISKILLKKYREILHTQFKDKKYLSWLNPYTEEKLAQKKGFIRWWGSGLFIASISAIVLFFMMILDPIIKKTLEYSLSKTGVEVTIDELSSNLLDSNLEIKNISFINNNQKHTVDSITVDIDGDNFLRKKLDIKLIDIQNISLDKEFISQISNNTQDSPESTSNKKEDNKEKKKENETKEFNLNLPSIESLLASEDVKSVNEAKEIKKRFDTINKKWQDAQNDKLDKNRFTQIKKQYEEIKKLSQNIKSKKDVENIIEKTKVLQKDLQSLQKDLKYYQKEYKKDKATIDKDLKSIKTLPQDDYKYLSSKYTLNEAGAFNIVSTYISEDITLYTKKALKYYRFIKPYLPTEEEDPEVIRQKGKWVKFKEYEPYPDFILQKLQANIQSKKFEGFTIEMTHKNEISNIDIITKNYIPKNIALDKNLHLEENKIDITTNMIINKFNSFEIDSKSDFKNTKFQFVKLSSNSDKIMNNILKDINSFHLIITSSGKIDEIDKMKLKINSDLDKLLKKGFDKELNRQIALYKKQLQKRLNDEVKKQLGDALGDEFKKYSKLVENKSLNQIKKELQDKYSTKTIQKQLEDKIKKDLEKKKKEELRKAKEKLAKEKEKAKKKLEEEKAKAKEKLEKKKKEEQKKLEEQLKNKLKNLF